MSSRATSSVPGSDITLPSSSSSNKNYRDLSEEEILREIQHLRTQGIHYAAEKNISNLCEFTYNNTIKGDILVQKNINDSPSEFILTGIFQIDGRNFFMTSDGKWNPSNPIGTRFDQVKPTCHLLPVQRNANFPTSSTDFPSIINNIHAIESLANPHKSHDNSSIVIGNSTAIKLTHHLFTV